MDRDGQQGYQNETPVFVYICVGEHIMGMYCYFWEFPGAPPPHGGRWSAPVVRSQGASLSNCRDLECVGCLCGGVIQGRRLNRAKRKHLQITLNILLQYFELDTSPEQTCSAKPGNYGYVEIG